MVRVEGACAHGVETRLEGEMSVPMFAYRLGDLPEEVEMETQPIKNTIDYCAYVRNQAQIVTLRIEAGYPHEARVKREEVRQIIRMLRDACDTVEAAINETVSGGE